IARRLGVGHQIVSDWRNAWRRSGREELRGAGRAGRLPKVRRDQLEQVETELAKGAAANGTPMMCGPCNARQRASSESPACATTRRGSLVHPPTRVTLELAAAGPPRDRAQ